MTDEHSLEGLLTDNEFFKATGLTEKARKKFDEAGYLVPRARVEDAAYYSQDQVELAKAMVISVESCGNTGEAYEMAVNSIELKKRRNSRTSELSLGDTDHRRIMDPQQIKMHPSFESLLPIDADLLSSITSDMALNGYYESHPIVLGKWEGQEEPVCIDGHTRIQAAVDSNIQQVHVVIEEFPNEQAALEHAIRLQVVRRKTDDKVLFRLIEKFDRVSKRGGDRRSEQAIARAKDSHRGNGRSVSAVKTAELVGCSPRTVERVRTILKYGSEEIKEDARSGTITIGQAHSRVVGVKPIKKSAHGSATPTQSVQIQLSEDNLAGLKELGGKIDHHINAAVEEYLRDRSDDLTEEEEDAEAGS